MNIKKKVNALGFNIKKYSPEILLGTGIAFGGISIVTACKATLKVNDKLDDISNDKKGIETGTLTYTLPNGTSIDDKNKNLAIFYTRTAVSIAKEFSIPVIFGTASVSCILMSHNIINKRNVALTAALSTVGESFKKYRGNVIEKFGEEVDKELKYGLEKTTITEKDEKGKEKKKEVRTVDPSDFEFGKNSSEFAILYTMDNDTFVNDPVLRKSFLKQMEQYANDKLRIQGYLFLNDVYKMLGMPETQAGQVVGWVYDENDESKNGDGFVEFYTENVMFREAIKHIDSPLHMQQATLIDFNIDGTILDKAFN